MDKKLTLSLDESIIAQAKKYAQQNGTSLSKMIESYFRSITSEDSKDDKIKITPLVESLCGVGELPADFDYKKSRQQYLDKKYS